MLAERKTLVVLEVANVAVSDGPLGMVRGIQFAARFQSPVAGLVFHVALFAKVLLAVESSRSSNVATITNKTAIVGADAKKALGVILMRRNAWCFS